jgi:hypothetical protein
VIGAEHTNPHPSLRLLHPGPGLVVLEPAETELFACLDQNFFG